MRIFLTIVLFLNLSGAREVLAQKTETGGMTFTVGLESFPGKTYYRLECLRYESGELRDYRTTQDQDAINSWNLTLRVAKMSRTGFKNLLVGIEVGMSVPVSGYEKSWDLPALTSEFSGEIRYPGFC